MAEVIPVLIISALPETDTALSLPRAPDDCLRMLAVTELPRCGGAEVELEDRRATEPELAQLRLLLATRGVLVVRGAACGVPDFAALCRGIGPLHDDVNGPGRGRLELLASGAGIELHYISNLDLATDTAMDGPTSMLSDANGDWHADYSWEPKPSRFTALFGIEVAAGGGAKTQLASTRRGFDSLSAELQVRCRGRVVRHRPGGADAGEAGTAAPNFAGTDHTAAGLQAARDAARRQTQGAALVDNHVVATVRRPLLLRGALLLGRHAYEIEGEDPEQGLLRELTSHCLDDSRVYTHEWREGDCLIWDNEAMLHRAVPGVSGTRRHLARTVIASLHGDVSEEAARL